MEDFSKSNWSKKPTKGQILKEMYGHKDNADLLGASVVQIKKHDPDHLYGGLNDQQSEMVKGIRDYLKGRTQANFFLVQGGGGTGKSFSINRALKGINPKQIIAAAPSHFAKNVLKDFLGEGYKVITIAALLGKRVTFNDEGDQILVRINTKLAPPIEHYPIVLIDEGSMVNDDTAHEILDYVRRGDKALIILGDYCQLPPVNQPHDAVFFSNVSAELTIPMRFTGPIYELTELVRNEIIKIRKGLVPDVNILNIATDRISKIDDKGTQYQISCYGR
jgi:hypothetical protein